MAYKGTEAQILVDEFNFSGDTSGVEVKISVSEEESTNLGSTAAEYEPILPMMSIDQNGYLGAVAASDELEAELAARLGNLGSYVAALFATSIAACPAYVKDGTFNANLQIQSPAKGLMTLVGSWAAGPGGSRGIRIFSGQIAATGNEAAVDLGSAGSNGGEAYLFVQEITGSATNASVKVQSATTEGGSYADEATFTFSAVGGFKQAMSGTVNRWVRLNTASLGGATDFTVVLIVCVDGVTQ